MIRKSKIRKRLESIKIEIVDDQLFHERTALDERAEKSNRQESAGAEAETAEIGRAAEAARNQTTQILAFEAVAAVTVRSATVLWV